MATWPGNGGTMGGGGGGTIDFDCLEPQGYGSVFGDCGLNGNNGTTSPSWSSEEKLLGAFMGVAALVSVFGRR